MSEFSQFISDIPPGISVLGGAIIALAGVFLTNVWNLYRLKKQFDYERTIRTDDRRADLRSELFLQTSEAVTIAVQTLGSIPNLEVAHDEIMRPFIERAPAFGKLNLIADCPSSYKLEQSAA